MLLFFVIIAVSGVAHCDQYCLQCNNVRTIAECTEKVQCSANQTCYTEEIVTAFGIMYNAGCRDLNLCSMAAIAGKRTAHLHVTCTGCCAGASRNDTTLGCNARLCGLPGTSSSGTSNVTKCYTCTNVTNVQQCNGIVTCPEDQMCAVHTEVLSEGGPGSESSRYSFGCARKDVCLAATKAMLKLRDTGIGKRSPVCDVCCGDSFCNNSFCGELFNKLWDLWKSGHLDYDTLKYIPE